MKQLLLLGMIHLLILHQYHKDKKEALARQKAQPTQTRVSKNLIVQDIRSNKSDSIYFPTIYRLDSTKSNTMQYLGVFRR